MKFLPFIFAGATLGSLTKKTILNPEDLFGLNESGLINYLATIESPKQEKSLIQAVILQSASKNQPSVLQSTFERLQGHSIYSFQNTISQALKLAIDAGNAEAVGVLLEADKSKGHQLLLPIDYSNAALYAINHHNWAILDDILAHVSILGSESLIKVFKDIRSNDCYQDNFVQVVIDSKEVLMGCSQALINKYA